MGERGVTRRRFLMRTALAAGATAAALGNEHTGKTRLSFYMDDTNPYISGVDTFAEFLDFVAEHKIAGDSSMILAYGCEEHGVISRPRTASSALISSNSNARTSAGSIARWS